MRVHAHAAHTTRISIRTTIIAMITKHGQEKIREGKALRRRPERPPVAD